MNLWNNLTNWIDTWFNTNTLITYIRLTRYVINRNYVLNKFFINKKLKLNYFTISNTVNINNLVCNSTYKLNTYKFNVKQ